MLTRGELRASFDFSLLNMMVAWHDPWKPETHFSFQPEFRAAVKTVVLSAHRLALPVEVSFRIIEFLSRDFWPDERKQCWNFECQSNTVSRNMAKKILREPSKSAESSASNNKPLTFDYCPACNVAMYCSEECRKEDWKDHHSRFCSAPPCLVPGENERRFCSTILNESHGLMVPEKKSTSNVVDNTITKVDEEDDGEEDEENEEDGDEEWEDIDSDEEHAEAGGDGQQGGESRTLMIRRFFDRHTYRPRQIQE